MWPNTGIGSLWEKFPKNQLELWTQPGKRIIVVEKCKVTCVFELTVSLMALHKHPHKQQERRWIMCRHLLYISTSSLYLTECPSHLLCYIDIIRVVLPLETDRGGRMFIYPSWRLVLNATAAHAKIMFVAGTWSSTDCRTTVPSCAFIFDMASIPTHGSLYEYFTCFFMYKSTHNCIRRNYVLEMSRLISW